MIQDITEVNHIVALKIYEYCKIKNEPIYFSKLVEIFKDVIERKYVSISIDFLMDICMIDAERETVEGKWVRCISCDTVYEPFLESMYKNGEFAEEID